MEEEKDIIEKADSLEENNNSIENEKEDEYDKVNVDNNFNGYFHERDRLDTNNIVDEVKTSFMEYSMSVIASRALPDLRDGLKPVHSRILW